MRKHPTEIFHKIQVEMMAEMSEITPIDWALLEQKFIRAIEEDREELPEWTPSEDGSGFSLITKHPSDKGSLVLYRESKTVEKHSLSYASFYAGFLRGMSERLGHGYEAKRLLGASNFLIKVFQITGNENENLKIIDAPFADNILEPRGE